ncbi:MAG: chromate resistance protein ChrB [Actinobacteria bacterium]|nr:chromate resistance protein ChrB [Actinomycetota bacterium]
MEKRKWLVINYNLPTEPSRLRVAAWRRLKKLGAVNIQQSMWVLPHNDHNYSALHTISQEIESNNGEALLMQCVFFDQKHEQKVISYFNNVRDEEYKELIDKCEDYFKELEKEIAIEKFTFAELEEEEEELNKLLSWYAKIETRDMFYSSQRDCAKEKLDQAKKAFANYSDMVFKYNNK